MEVKGNGFSLELKEVLESIPYGVAFLDDQLRVVSINSLLEVLTGYQSEKVKGLEVNQVIKTNVFKELKTGIKKEEKFIIEGDIIDVNRRKIPVKLIVKNIFQGKRRWVILVVEELPFWKEKIPFLPQAEIDFFLGNSPAILKIKEMLPIFAASDATLLIEGETGTGKDLFAEVIHKLSKRADQPFIKVNCGALPETLLESELFGYVKGAFTGANTDKPGMIRLANGGTLFLTEISELPLNLQVKLLTFLDDKEFYPLGSSKKVRVDVRIIVATNKNLKQMVKEGKFREDLFYRLNVLKIQLPPLRERGDDVLILADHFLNEFAKRSHKKIKGFSEGALKVLKFYKYPGNVRELRNIIEYAVHVSSEDLISEKHLPEYIFSSIKEEIEGEKKIEKAEIEGIFKGSTERPFSWAEFEKKKIIEALISCNGKKSEAAKKLGWARSTLWRKLKEYGLE
uniref:PAS domain S-box protein n=1 Tax=Thermodesulfobacterium geofontis TaxID=1295609 RepID=A0A7V5XH40_9BACT